MFLVFFRYLLSAVLGTHIKAIYYIVATKTHNYLSKADVSGWRGRDARNRTSMESVLSQISSASSLDANYPMFMPEGRKCFHCNYSVCPEEKYLQT